MTPNSQTFGVHRVPVIPSLDIPWRSVVTLVRTKQHLHHSTPCVLDLSNCGVGGGARASKVSEKVPSNELDFFYQSTTSLRHLSLSCILPLPSPRSIYIRLAFFEPLRPVYDGRVHSAS